jgi:threonine/homoserine/homoserine lactone efflux protein
MFIEAPCMSPNLLLAYGLYALGTASPGPSNLAVMSTAVNHGRKPALLFALGVLAGSITWGLVAALGLSAVLARVSVTLVALKILGGLYLLWLALKSGRSAVSVGYDANYPVMAACDEAGIRVFLRGAGMHLSNPKAIFVWLSLVTLALPMGVQRSDALLVVAGCLPIGLAVFCGYALLFSTRVARLTYLRLRRWIDGTLAVLFGYAGVRMLLART